MKRMKMGIAVLITAALLLVCMTPLAVFADNTRYPTPGGYNDNDYQKLVTFLELEDESGVRNGEKISENYDPQDPTTWEGTTWENGNIFQIDFYDRNLIGKLDVSNCTELVELDCSDNQLTELDISNNTAMWYLDCGYNQLTELDVSNNTALEHLGCYNNQLTELDISNNTAMLVNVPHSYGLPTTQPSESRLSYSGGNAEELSFIGREFMKLKQATYSTCKTDSQDWYLKSPDIELDFNENEGVAKNSTLWFKDIPIFYSPYFAFPVSKQRKSGFLAPTYKSSTKTGFDLTVPYYFNIAPNYDLTLYPRWMSKRGFQLGADARYLFKDSNGYLRGEYLPHDVEGIRSKRFAYQFRHWHTISAEHGITAYIDYNRVSDGLYWQDLSSRLLDTTQVHLPQTVSLNWRALDWINVNLQNVRYQTLQTDVNNKINSPYFIQPQINISGFKPNIFSLPLFSSNKNSNAQNSTRNAKYFLDFDFSFIGQFSRFTHHSLPSANRYVFYPQISAPFITPGFQITPKIGWNYTYYNFINNYENFLVANSLDINKTNYSRSLPIFSIDSSMTFERNIKVANFWTLKDGESEYRQTLEPHLYYVYIPYRKQSHLPTFDTGLNDFNFGQMFSENRYSGYDRINDANQLTLALTSRLLGKSDGVEYFKAMIGQRYYFQPQKVTLVNNEKAGKDFSHIVASMTGLVYNKTYADTSIEYNHKNRSTERFSFGVRYQPDYGKVLSMSYRYIK